MKKTKMTALRVLVAMSFFASSQVLGQVAESSSFFDVVKYGAVGDGKTLCTKAIEIDPQRFAVAYAERAFIYYTEKEYDKAWDDVHKAESLGQQARPEFLKTLREASGRKK